MDLALNLSAEQINWLKNVTKIIFEEKVKFAKDWKDGVADVIVFENGSYIWCFPSETPYVQGEGTFHFPRFADKDEYYMVHSRLKNANLSPTDIGDFSDMTGIPSNNGRIGQYTFLTYNIKGYGLDFEVCMETDHEWAFVSEKERLS
ncbi:MAG: hypothetical protein FWE05_08440 [Defluviitaleaceae bacterium]|nr:hypothetical protein [Defluviitaleaceae bacterium]